MDDDGDSPREDMRDRRCHDIFWLLLFILVLAGVGAVGYFAFRYGDINRLIYGRDSEGNLCGSNIGDDSTRDLSTRRQLYYLDLGDSGTARVCINSCPTVTAQEDVIVCWYDVNPVTPAEKAAALADGTCVTTMASKSVLNRCIPSILLSDIRAASDAANANQELSSLTTPPSWGATLSRDLNARNLASIVFQDLVENWWVIVICMGGSFVLSYVWLLLLSLAAGFIIWLTITLLLASSWGLTAYCIYNYVRITVLHQGLWKTGWGGLDAAFYNEKLLLGLGIGVGVVAAILTIVILCLIGRIRLATQVLREAGKAVRAMPSVLFFPLMKYIILLIWMVFFIFVMALLSTSADAIKDGFEDELNGQLNKIGKSYQDSRTALWLQLYFVFGFLWTYNWLLAIAQCSIAGAIATWYWTRDKSQLPSGQIFRAWGRTIRYHLGSLALGSLIIAIVQLIRIIILELQRRLHLTGSKPAQLCLCCVQCCCGFIERILRMLTKNAYVEIAVYGYSFCTACRMAAQLILANALRLIVLNRVSNFLVFLGKLVVVCVSTLGGLGLLVYLEGKDEIFANYAIPIVFILVFSYITASSFLSAFSMTITTIFMSFCEDSQRNDGSRHRPYYMSKELQKFVDKHEHDKPAV
ncbi:plasma-membrane choline transporter-domain-containing protein [Gaertneriomyces semiglobifer]|nr:plasma-membrane choline transporter-domain-containing protein [Gaertneriomyces semiglobifer]